MSNRSTQVPGGQATPGFGLKVMENGTPVSKFFFVIDISDVPFDVHNFSLLHVESSHDVSISVPVAVRTKGEM